MAEPFDTLAAQQVATFQALMSVQMTPEEAEAAVAEVFETLSLNSGVLEAVKATLGRVRGMFVVSAPPSDFLGVPGSTAFDPTNRIWYGPKDAVTGWPTGVAFIDQGPAGVISSVTTEIIAAGEAVEVVAGGTPENRTLTFRLPDVTTLTQSLISILGRADLYEMDRTYDATQFMTRGTEHDFLTPYYRAAIEAETGVPLDLTGFTGGCSTGGYSRNSLGFYQSFAANVPRRTDLGLLREGQTTNLFPRFAPTRAQLGLNNNVSNAAEAASPPIAGLAWLTLTNTSTDAWAYQTIILTGSTTYTMSVLVEAPDGVQPVASASTGTGDFRLLVGSGTAPGPFYYERLSGNIWRVHTTITTPASVAGNNNGVIRYTTQNTRALKFSGFQLEAGSLCTTPIITTGAAATRTADAGEQVLPETVAQGTLLVDVVLPVALPTSPQIGLAALLNGANTQWLGLGVGENGSVRLSRRPSSGVDATTIASGAGVAVAGQRLRVAFSFGLNGTDYLSVNGGAAISASGAASAYALTKESIGRFLNNPAYLNGRVRQCAYIPKRMTAAEVQTLSTLT